MADYVRHFSVLFFLLVKKVTVLTSSEDKAHFKEVTKSSKFNNNSVSLTRVNYASNCKALNLNKMQTKLIRSTTGNLLAS